MNPITRTAIAFLFSACLAMGALLSGAGNKQLVLWCVAMASYALALVANLHEMRAEGRPVGWTGSRRLPVAGLNVSAVLLALLLTATAFSRLG